jgi:hypothetical protein
MRPLDKIREKWKARATAAAPDYQFGVANPLKDWATQAAAASDAWKAGVTDAAGRDAFRKGVTRAGTAKWQRKALELGVPRYSQGVAVAAPDYEAGWKPFYEALTKIELPPRGPRGDPRT